MILSPFLVIEIALDPNIIKIGNVLITWHGLFTAVGIFVGLNIVLRLAALSPKPYICQYCSSVYDINTKSC